MDQKWNDLNLDRIVIVLWLLSVHFRGSLGNNKTALVHNGTFIYATTSLPVTPTVPDYFDAFSKLAKPSAKNQQLRLSYYSSTVSHGTSKETVSEKLENFERKATFIFHNGTSYSTVSTLTTSSVPMTSPGFHSISTILSNPSGSSTASTLSGPVNTQSLSSFPSNFLQPSSSKTMSQEAGGFNKTFIAELRITSLNFTERLKNKSSTLFHTTASFVTEAIDFVMVSHPYYLGCQVVSFRDGSVIAKIEVKLAPDASSDPNFALELLRTSVASGHVANLTVDSTYFVAWMKNDPPVREVLVSGQLAGVAVIFFILIALVLVICLGSFADEPLFEEREIFSTEMMPRNVVTGRDNEGSKENEEWKYDPLFAWSRPRTFDSKL